MRVILAFHTRTRFPRRGGRLYSQPDWCSLRAVTTFAAGKMFNPYFHFHQVFIDPRTRTVIAMTPKVMTTFIRAALRDGYRRFHDRPDPSEGRYRFAPMARRFPLPAPGAYVDALIRPGRYQAYGFARNPYWRLHSAWRNKFHDPHFMLLEGRIRGYPPSVRHDDEPRLRRFAAARGLPGATPGVLIPFDTFARYAVAQREFRRNKHWRGQALTLQLSHFPGMRVFTVEKDADSGLEEVLTRLGFDRTWVRRRIGQPRNVSSKLNGSPFDEELAGLVYEGYRDDFIRFGYDRESWRV